MKKIFTVMISSCCLGTSFHGVASAEALTATEKINDSGMTLTMSLPQVIDSALKNNVLKRLAHERINAAKARKTQDRADLLPHFTAGASQTRTYWDNYAAAGFPDFGVVGPYNSFDARVYLVARVFDLGAFSKLKAADLDIVISRLQDDLAQDQITVSAALSYLDVLSAGERLRAIDQDILLARETVQLADHQLQAGIVTRLDLVRAKTKLAQESARRLAILEYFQAARLQLARITGMPMGSSIMLSESLRFYEEPILSAENAIKEAFKNRLEMAMADRKLEYRQVELSKANRARLPVVDLTGNYGRSGIEPHEQAHDAAQIGMRVSMPIFEGGLIAGQIKESQSQKAQEEIQKEDMRTQVEEDVRLAVQVMETSTSQVKAAQEELDLAMEQERLAKDEYADGLANNIELIDAHTVLERARESYVTVLAKYHMTRVNYYSAIGRIKAFHLNHI
ncbi:MAG: TolC family protein [Candidatus Omnitrophica bacterium]|nr:TolC family protein [Candidatus Omnitrophota bacterium]